MAPELPFVIGRDIRDQRQLPSWHAQGVPGRDAARLDLLDRATGGHHLQSRPRGSNSPAADRTATTNKTTCNRSLAPVPAVKLHGRLESTHLLPSAHSLAVAWQRRIFSRILPMPTHRISHVAPMASLTLATIGSFAQHASGHHHGGPDGTATVAAERSTVQSDLRQLRSDRQAGNAKAVIADQNEIQTDLAQLKKDQAAASSAVNNSAIVQADRRAVGADRTKLQIDRQQLHIDRSAGNTKAIANDRAALATDRAQAARRRDQQEPGS